MPIDIYALLDILSPTRCTLSSLRKQPDFSAENGLIFAV